MRRALLVAAAVLAGCRPASQGARVVVAYPAGPASLVPYALNEEHTLSVLGNVFETLVDLDEGLALVPGLAESWHMPDDVTWVFRIREGVRLHDGRILGAKEVAGSLERARTDPRSRRQAELAAVTAVEVRDPRTLVIRTRYPFAHLPNRLASVPIWTEAAQAGGVPVGTGPYRVARWTPGGDTLLEAFDGYRAGAPAIRSLEFRVVPSVGERIARLRAGAVHLVVDVPPEEMPRLAALPSVKTLSRQGLRILFLGADCDAGKAAGASASSNPFRDPRVRRAVAMAIDRAALVRGPLGGHAEVVDQVVPAGVFGHDAALPPIPHDPDGARRLLHEAGRGDGFATALDFMPAKYRAMPAVAAAIAADLAAVGIRVAPRPAEPAAFFERLDRREMPLYLLGWMSENGDAGLSYEYLVHSRGGGYGQDNAGSYSNPEVDRLLEEAAQRIDPDDRRHLLATVAERVRDDMPIVPLYRQNDLYAFAERLEFQPRLDRRIVGARLRWRP